MAISLEKGQKISLEKSAGGSLSKIVMGLGWDTAKASGLLGGLFGGGDGDSIDLDASCVMFDENKKAIDTVYFGHLISNDGSIKHTGDNRTGDGDGDDEQIIVDLTRVPSNVTAIVFTVNSYTGQTFDKVANCYCRMVNQGNNKEIARYDLKAKGGHTAMVMAKVYRHNGEWKMHAIGETANARTIDALIPAIISSI